MLADTLTLNDGTGTSPTGDHTMELVSREGMSSKRRDITSGITSAAMAALVIKHTIDEKSKTKPNRHLVLYTFTEQDAAGVDCQSQAHFVITRHKKATDAQVQKEVAILVDFLSDPANVTQLLIGGN